MYFKKEVKKSGAGAGITLPRYLIGEDVIVVTQKSMEDLEELVNRSLFYMLYEEVRDRAVKRRLIKLEKALKEKINVIDEDLNNRLARVEQELLLLKSKGEKKE